MRAHGALGTACASQHHLIANPDCVGITKRDGGNVEPPQGLHQGEACRVVHAHHIGGDHLALARAQPDGLRLVDKISDCQDKPRLPDQHGVARPFGAKGGRREGVFGHDRTYVEDAGERPIKIEDIFIGLGLEGGWHLPVAE
jgi:hypothetical protein